MQNPPQPSPNQGALRDLLQASLGDAYTIERELGGGGMSRVFVARERALDRRVVVKVLPDDLAAEVSTERFRREIQLVAGLQHPHIVPVHATGVIAGAPYYTMPFIEGESLRARLSQRGALPVGEALHVLHDVIDALAYAHERGIVHRDIKPDNILMSGSHAVVTDFGVAKALSAANVAARDDGQGTGIGMAVGTPAYMAPEQAAGDPATDHRADVYAWGLLAYELLAGATPFGKRSAHELLAAHIAELPVPIAERCPEIPVALADLIMRCLEKRPGARPQSAREVRTELEQVTTPHGGTPARSRRRWYHAPRVRVAAVAVVVALSAIAALALRRHPLEVDENTVAVLPFRLTSADPSLRYLREGMLDLLAAKLTGEGGPRSADPRTLLSAWRRAVSSDTAELPREQALELAERVGAGQLLVGDISGTAQQLTLTASLVRVRDGRADAPRRVSGPADSLPAMVDRLASELLALRAGQGERIGTFAGVPLASLRAYLGGISLYRRAHFAAAGEEFKRALDFDSTFALAGLGLATASGWVGSPKDGARGIQTAWKYRSRLSARDRALLDATAGPDYPANSGWASLLAAREKYAALAPDRAEAQFELGDGMFHFGPAVGIVDAHARAAAAFNRAIALDSTFSPAMEHLLLLELESGDTARVRQLGTLYLAADSASENRDGVRWAMAVARGDSAGAQAIASRADSLTTMAVATIGEISVAIGRHVPASQALHDALLRSAKEQGSRVGELVMEHDLGMLRGRPARASSFLDSLRALPLPPGSADIERVKDALYWDGDTTGVRASAQFLRSKGLKKQPKTPYFADLCVSEMWLLSSGDTSTTRMVMGVLRDGLTPRNTAPNASFRAGCALTLEAQLAVTQHRPDARAAVDRLDAFLRTGPGGFVASTGNLAAARLYERLGDDRAALFAIRRRDFFYGRPQFMTTYLRDEARLAAKMGDAAGASEALRRYMALRSDPEPSLAGDLAQAKASWSRVSRTAGGR